MASMLDDALKKVDAQEAPLAPVRGFRDFLPKPEVERQRIITLLRASFERYGFQPLETPALESWDLLASKYAGGGAILKETYSLKDQGDRRLGLRYDLTVPLCRVVANNPNLLKPFKRYQIAPVWRDGPIRLGRYREFVQCDGDTVGAPVGLADAEVLALATDAYQSLGLEVVLLLNNRKLLWGLLELAAVPEQKRLPVVLTLDKMDKIGMGGVVRELQEQQNLDLETVNKLVGVLNELTKATSDEEKLAILESKLIGSAQALEGVRETRELLQILEYFGPTVRNSVKLDPFLARGLNYYTGPVFEAKLRNDVIGRSVGGGGRYDDLIGSFAGSSEKIPAVGFSFGLDVIIDAIQAAKSPSATQAPMSTTRVFVISIGPEAQGACVQYVQRIRRAGLNASIDLLGRGPSKNLEYASKQGIPYVVLVGKQELEQGKIKLKDLRTGDEKVLAIETALELLTDEQAIGKL